MPDRATVERFIAMVVSGRHAEAIEAFYAEDATMQENFKPPRRGRDALAAGERAVLARMKRVHTHPVTSFFIEGEEVVIHWIFEFESLEGKHTRIEELAHQRWQDGKIVAERFYYDPAQLT